MKGKNRRPRSMWRIGDILVQKGWITPEQLQYALSFQSTQESDVLGNILSQQSLITQRKLYRALAIQCRMPFIDLRHYKIEPHLLHAIPISWIHQYRIIPVAQKKGQLVLATANPHRVFMEPELHSFLELQDVSLVMGMPADIEEIIHAYFGGESRHAA